MNRLIRSVIAGGIFATLAGLMMQRTPRKTNMMNRMMNTTINGMGRLGIFRMMGRSRMFRNMVRAR